MIKTEKEYKVSHKTYFNERLKKGLFHNKQMHPLYVQVIFDRVPLDFKSYYYDLFSKPKYSIHVAGETFAPDIKKVIEKENQLAEFIINKNLKSFSLELFKKEYAFYCRDLLDLMEPPFLNYLNTFLQDEGLPYLADALQFGARDTKAYELVQDMKRAFNPSLYKKLVENSFYHAPPYLPLYAFSLKPQRTALVNYTVMEWEQLDAKEKFMEFFKRNYPQNEIEQAMKEIQGYVLKP